MSSLKVLPSLMESLLIRTYFFLIEQIRMGVCYANLPEKLTDVSLTSL